MPGLPELQRRCYEAFLHGRTDALTPFVAGSDPAAAIGIYQNNALELFRKTLTAAYPVIVRLTGEACFRTLSRDYMRRHPSRSGNLERFGAAFASFLDATYGGTRHAWLADVARLEWACEEALLAAEAAPWDPSVLATLAPEAVPALRFALHPACRLVRSRWPIFSIWQANATEQPDPPAVSLAAGPEQVLVSRATRLELRLLSPLQAAFVEALLAGADFGSACAAAAAVDVRFDPAPLLRQLMAWQVLVGCSLAESVHRDPQPRE